MTTFSAPPCHSGRGKHRSPSTFAWVRHVVTILLTVTATAVPLSPLRGSENDYLQQVKPVLRERCYACHGALKQESDLRVDTVKFLQQGGASGPAVVPRSADESELLQRISSDDETTRMPPEGKPLTAEEIAAIREWITAGAIGPNDEQPERDPNLHWAFLAPEKAPLPRGDGIAEHPVDAFLDAARRQQTIQAGPPAAKSLLLRRLYLDVLGFPPTRNELRAFMADDSPQAWENAVDRVLSSPHYGERWGRHWMDVWRYSDWYGLGQQLRNSQKHIWRWRDWIVESLNEDKGYDQMVLEMLAGDELAPTDPQTLRATGFLARNYYLFNRTTWLDNTIEHTSKAFLGLTVNCAKCHDHKYDPISQRDYYQLRAVFEPHQVRLDSVPGQLNLEKDGLPRVFDAHPDEPTYVHVRGNAAEPDKSQVIEPAPLGILGHVPFQVQPVTLPLAAHAPQYRDFVLRDALAAAAKETEALEAQSRELRKQRDALPTAGVVAPASEAFITDPFDRLMDGVWEPGEGAWSYQDGVLRQSAVGATRRAYVSRENHPRDFVAKLRFRIRGGQKWKSVGLFFDSTDGRDKTVYMSGVNGGQKIQVSYNRDGKSTYPVEGKVDRPVATNRWYELQVVVRDNLVNAAIDGEETVAYRFPIAREAGRIGFMAFDADVEFDALDIAALHPKYVMRQPQQTKLSPEMLAAELAVVECQLAAAALKPAMLRTSFQAGRAVAAEVDGAQALVASAALATRKFESAEAATQVALAKKELLKVSDDKKREELQKKVAAAEKSYASAVAAEETPGESFYTMSASLKALEGPAETDESRRKPYPKTSTGRRTALARWIVDRQNPLTARVAVNHIWMRHMGQPLVESVTDFGRRAPEPVQHELLDWLAADLMEHSWSMKRLHRLILTSSAYRLSTSAKGQEENLRRDPTNQYYWRRVASRMESEVIRDSLLHLAGELDLTLGGPTVPASDRDSRRRSIYYAHSRDDQSPFLVMFDDADILRCYRRQESVVPQQALTMANSKLSLEMSHRTAAQIDEQLSAEAGVVANEPPTSSDELFVVAAFETVLGREPTPEEKKTCQMALEQFRALPRPGAEDASAADASRRARGALVHALVNHNDFVTIR